ncbi:hypothetical protein PGQ11_003326 [Apiospora arundinis]|uniref:Uncharacterized protein n=1 Tax=Apiospora arundinis TaxID=335852 RepID=A0ABR2J5W2_9PEZI
MSDAGAVADPSATTDGIGTWKLVLAILLPLLCIAIGVCVFLYWRQRKHRTQKADIEQVGTMLQELKTSKAEVDAMRYSLHDGLERNTLQGTLPRAAPGLQHTQYQYSRSRASSYQSAESGETAISYKPPSTIPEESTGNVSSSPFDTPGKKSTDQVVEAEQDESPSCRGERTLTKRVGTKARALIRRNSLLSPRSRLSPIRQNPSHPDLVPQPLAVTKRNSVRETSDESNNSLRARYGIDKTRLRRSASNPPANRSHLSDSDLVTPTIPADKTNSPTFVEDSTVETLSILQERRDGGNSNKKHGAKRSKNKKNKKQSHSSSETLLASEDNKNEKATPKVARNTPTPPSSGPPPPGSPPKRPLPVLPSRIPVSTSHRRSLEAGHRIVGKLHNPTVSNTVGPRKRSSLSSMRFSQSPSKRRSQFLLGASSFSSPIRGGRASINSPSAITSPGKQRLPPSYASSQCLPSVETMGSLASESTSSSSSADDSSSCARSQDTKKTESQTQQENPIDERQARARTPQQHTGRTFDNVTINRGGQSGHRGHARLLSELSATLRLVHEEEDAAAEQAVSTAASTRTTAAGVSS